MPGWFLPAVAGAFAAGCLLTAGRRPNGPIGWGLIVVSLVVLAGAVASGGRRRRRSSSLVGATGLLGPVGPPGPRDRILGAGGLAARVARPSRRPGAVVTVAALIAVATAGAGWTMVRAPPGPGPLHGRYVGFEGTATSDPLATDWGWTVEVRLDRVRLDGRVVGSDLRVWASGSGERPAISAGQAVAGSGSVETVPRPAEDFDAYLIGRGVTARLRTSDLAAGGRPANLALRVANTVRDGFRRGAIAALPERQAGLLLGLAIGDTESMDPEVEEDFRASGLAHLLAVSGSNVALVVAPALAVAARLRLRSGGRAVVALGTVALFALVTRWEPSVLRASAMAAIGLAAVWSGRPRRTAPALGGAVVALLLVDPVMVSSVGFQLSVAATAGLAALAGPLTVRMTWLSRPVAAAAAATLAAQIAVTPLLLLRFGTVPTVTLLANVLAFPAVVPALFLGAVGAAVALPWPGAGSAVGGLAGAPLGYLIGLSDRMARFPLPSVTGGPGVAVLAAAAGAFVVWLLRRGKGPGPGLVAAALVAAVAWSAIPSAGPPRSLDVTFLDVGQGDAAVIRTPEGATVLIDAGPDDQEVATDLAALGVRRIDLAVATHAHADHVEGFPAIVARFPVGLLLEPGCPADSPSYARFVGALADEEVPVRHPRGGQRLTLGRLVVEVLGPDRCSLGGASPNDDSVVLRMTFGRASVLFPGDAEVPAQRDMLADGDPVTATVLKVPHHGGDTSHPGFLDATEAAVAVVSTGPNDYGHPSPGVLALLRAEGMTVVRTDRAGDVTVSFADDGSPVVASGR